MGIYTRLGALIPKKIREKIAKEIMYAGLSVDTQRLLGFIIIFGLVLSALLSYMISFLFKWPFHSTFVAALIVLFAGIYYKLNSAAEKKAKFVEAILPDAL